MLGDRGRVTALLTFEQADQGLLSLLLEMVLVCGVYGGLLVSLHAADVGVFLVVGLPLAHKSHLRHPVGRFNIDHFISSIQEAFTCI